MIKNLTIYLLISIFLFFSLINILRSTTIFLLENISIREAFHLPNIYLDVDKDGKTDFVHKGIREGGSRYNDIFYKNLKILESLNYKKIINLYNRVRTISANNVNFKLESELISKLKILSNESNLIKKETAIYIPKSTNFFWNMSCDKHTPPFIITSITNIAMIFGLPEDKKRSCYPQGDYGLNQLYLLQNQPLYYNFNKLSSDVICAEAINKKFKRIIEINLNSKNEIIFINHLCGKKDG